MDFVRSSDCPGAAPDGGALYQTHCAQCHDNGAARADRETLKTMLPTRVLAAMETGPMISMATGRSVAERRAIAEFVTGKTFSNAFDLKPPPQAMCMGTPPEFNPESAARWSGWGVTTSNTRFQEAPMAGLTAADVARLQLKWAFAFPGDLQSNAQSTIAGGRVFVGSAGGRRLLAETRRLAVSTGIFETGAPMRAAISIGRLDMRTGPRWAAFFGDGASNAYALDAATGKLLWKTKVENFPVARITGSPTFHRGRLYVARRIGRRRIRRVAHLRVLPLPWQRRRARTPKRGRWCGRATPFRKKRFRHRKTGSASSCGGHRVQPVWSSPAIDEKRNALYVTTGNNYSDPPSKMSDSFLALDLEEREDPVVPSDDDERRVHVGMPAARQDQLR